jgi:hypothetical protein
VSVEITPEPSPEEHEALLRAIAALDDSRDAAPAWWRAGIQDAVEGEPEEENA